MTTDPSAPPSGKGRARPLDPESKPDDRVDNALRPQKLSDLIGQYQVKDNLGILIAAARQRDEGRLHGNVVRWDLLCRSFRRRHLARSAWLGDRPGVPH